MKQIHSAAVVATIGLVAVGALAGCDSSAGNTSSPKPTASGSAASEIPGPVGVPTACESKSGGALKIGVVDIDEQTSFFTQLNTGVQTVGEQAGAEVQIVSGQDDAAKQVAGVENLVAAKVDAIIIDPYDGEAVAPALKAAKAAGIPVVAVDGTVSDTSAIDTQVGTANSDGGRQLGEAFVELTGGEGEVGIVSALNSSIQVQRQNGFEEAVKAGGLTIGTVVDGQNVNEKAQTAAENLLTGNPGLKYIYATGSPAMNGAIAAVRSQGVTDSVSIVGWDLDAASYAGIQDGVVKAVIVQDSYGFGYASAIAAINLACKSADVPATISVPINIVTKDNLAKYEYFLKG